MKRMLIIAAAGVAVAVAASAIAQTTGYTGPSTAAPAAKPAVQSGYTGPSSVPLMTAKDLLANGKDDQAVKLKGKLLSHKGGDEYEFADASGRIVVEIDDRLFPAGTAVDHNTVVELTGEFDKETFGDSTVDVEQLKVVGR